MLRKSLAVLIIALCSVSAAFAQGAPGEIAKLAAALPKVVEPVFARKSFNVKDFGAVGDGVAMNTKAFADAISAAAKNGGTVVVPAGVWVTGPIVLKSGVNLHLERNAILSFSRNRLDFPLVETSFEGVAAYRAQSPISATNATNIAITGEGVIDANGEAWRPVKRDKLNERQWKDLVASGGKLDASGNTWWPSESALAGSLVKNAGQLAVGVTKADVETIRDFLRPNMIQIRDSKNILIEGVTIQNSPAWTMHFVVSEHITIRGVTVKNPWYGQNNDAVDLESSRNAVLENCVFDTGDDAITLKSGRDEEGRRRGIPTENVVARNMTIYHGHGGFVIGSEMSGGVRNVFIFDSSFIGTDNGLRFKTQRGRGGLVERVYAENIFMKDIPGDAILFDMYYGGRGTNNESVPVTAATPRFENFLLRNIVVQGANRGVFLRGLPEMNVRDVRLENLTIQSETAIVSEEATDVSFRNITLLSRKTNPVIDVTGGGRLTFDGLKFTPNAEVLVQLNRANPENVKMLNTDVSKAKLPLRASAAAVPGQR